MATQCPEHRFRGQDVEAVMTGAVVSPACRLRDLLSRSPDPDQRRADPENQVDGFLGEGYPLRHVLEQGG